MQLYSLFYNDFKNLNHEGSTTRYSHVTTIFIQMSTVTIEQEVPAIIAHDHQNARCQVMRKRERKQNHFFFFCDVWHFNSQWFFIPILAFFQIYMFPFTSAIITFLPIYGFLSKLCLQRVSSVENYFCYLQSV